jgi:cation diffusion facilitator CzcD-associated flavoprotein CzcO
MAQASPKVMIVGAGLGGLVLGILLEKMGIEYNIFERSAVCKPYGTHPSLPFASQE